MEGIKYTKLIRESGAKKMIQSIRIFREKKDDIWASYLIEFFRLIGIIAFDYVFPEDSTKIDEEFQDIYDHNIFLNIEKEALQNDERFFSLKHFFQQSDSNKITYLPLSEFEANKRSDFKISFNEMKTIFDKDDQIFPLLDIYSRSNAFYYLYNKGNLQFIEEYYPIYGDSDETIQNTKLVRERAIDSTFKEIALLYIELCNEMDKNRKKSKYYQYAIINCRHKLNQICDLKGEGHIFDSESMLQELLERKQRGNNLLLDDYLAGGICSADRSRMWGAEDYYVNLVRIIMTNDAQKAIGDFLYYKIGRYFEHKRGEIRIAEQYYDMAYECNPNNYRVLFKLAKRAERENDDNQLIEKANRIIELLLNGYQISKLTPKQQIYIYKCYVLLGKCYLKKGDFDLALMSFEKAVLVADTDSEFYLYVQSKKDTDHTFKQILLHCMPLQPVYLNIMKSASGCGEIEKVDEYQEKLRNIYK